MMKKIKETGKCSLCGGTYTQYGNNPAPLLDCEMRCCGDCNALYVIPARIRLIHKSDSVK